MKQAEDNLRYYQNQKQNIIKNKQSYQTVHYHNEYGAWQSASYVFYGWDIYHTRGTSWWYPIQWKKGDWWTGKGERIGYHMKSDPATQASVRVAIAQKLGRSLEEISPNLVINARGEDPTYHFDGPDVLFHSYTVGYQHRQLITKEERFFDQAKYEQALKGCEQNIQQTQVSINQLRKQEELQREAARRAAEAKAKLEEQRAAEQRYKEELQQEVTQTQAMIAQVKQNEASITARIAQETARRQANEAEYLRVVQASTELQKKLDDQQSATYAKLQEADAKQRAFFLIQLWGRPGSEYTINAIKSLGFDANDLAHLAVEQNHSELFDLAMQYGANCSDTFISSTIINAIGQNDLVILEKLLAMKPELVNQKCAGYTLLQIAISAEGEHLEVIKKLLLANNKLAEILTSNGESALKIAVRMGNEEVIKLVAGYANLNIELEQFGAKIDQSKKQEIMANNDMVGLIQLFKGVAEEEFAEREQILIEESANAQNAIEIGLQGLALDEPGSDHIDI